jgi:hypothetical protein
MRIRLTGDGGTQSLERLGISTTTATERTRSTQDTQLTTPKTVCLQRHFCDQSSLRDRNFKDQIYPASASMSVRSDVQPLQQRLRAACIPDQSQRLSQMRPAHFRDPIPVVGYDVADGSLKHNMHRLQAISVDQLAELARFRQYNRDQCISIHSHVYSGPALHQVTPAEPLQRPACPDSDGDDQEAHTEVPWCNPAYTLDSRLFPVVNRETTHAVHVHTGTAELCQDSPMKKFVRVSIPHNITNKSTHHLKSQAYNPKDSVSLSRHCVPGWQAAKVTSAPAAQSLSLSSKVRRSQSWKLVDGAGIEDVVRHSNLHYAPKSQAN